MVKKATLILDIGNSGTKALLEVGPFKGVVREFTDYFEVSNQFAQMYRAPRNLNTNDYTKDNSVIFQTEGVRMGSIELSNRIWANGLYAEREQTRNLSKPTASLDKFNSEFTALSVIVAIYKAALILSERIDNKVPIEMLISSIEWDLTILLPPEQAIRQKTFKEDIQNIKNVKFFLPDMETKMNIKRVTIQQEGYTAFFGVMYDRKTKKPFTRYKDKLKKRILIIDIGGGTTDLMLVQDGKAIEISKKTVNIGGNNVVAQAHAIYSQEEDIRIIRDAFEEAVQTGKVYSGTKEIDVVDYINEAKFLVAQNLINEIREYLNATQIEPTTIQNMLVVGGGSMRPENEAIDIIGEVLIQEFKKYAPDIELIHVYPDSEDEILVEVDEFITPRTVNLIGASILTDIRDLTEEK